MKVTGNDVPRAIGQGCGALLSGLEVARINRARQIRQGFGSGSQGEFNGSCLNAVAENFLHSTESLWIADVALALNTAFWQSDAVVHQDKVGAGEALCGSFLLCLMLEGLDGIPRMGRIFPTGSGALLEDPNTRGTNTTAEFGV
jgi:hypothetical protein